MLAILPACRPGAGKVKKMLNRLLAMTLLSAAGICPADTQSEREIQHLLQFTAKSDCQFIRNGKSYGPAQAREHLAKKYAAVQNRIRSAEDFIRYIASESSITKEPYRVQCPGAQATPSGPWLTLELRRLRKEEKPAVEHK